MARQDDDTTMSWLAGRSVLVTGGGGFIAASLIRLLCGIDCRIVRLLRRPAAAWPDPGRARIVDMVGDVRDPALWWSLPVGIDVVFHLAAQTSTYEANRDPRADLDSNVLPMLLMLQACLERGLSPAVICASTVTICGLPDRLPVGLSCCGGWQEVTSGSASGQRQPDQPSLCRTGALCRARERPDTLEFLLIWLR